MCPLWTKIKNKTHLSLPTLNPARNSTIEARWRCSTGFMWKWKYKLTRRPFLSPRRPASFKTLNVEDTVGFITTTPADLQWAHLTQQRELQCKGCSSALWSLPLQALAYCELLVGSEVKTVFWGQSWWNIRSPGERGDMKVSTSYCSRPAFPPWDLSAHPLHLDSDRIKWSSLSDFLSYCNSL